MSYELKEMKIHVSELRLGMNVVRLDRPWEETEFLLQGFVVNHVEEIEALQELCEHVYIEAKHHHIPVAQASTVPREKTELYAKIVRKEPEGDVRAGGEGL